MNWPTAFLEEITEKIGSGATPLGGESAYQKTGIPLIRSMNVHDGRFKPDGLAFINEEQARALNNVKLVENDVLLNITGASVGRVCRLPAKYAGGRVNQHVAIIRPKLERLCPEYLEHCLISPTIKKALLTAAGAGATREAITKKAIQETQIPLPPLDEQRRIAGILDQADALRRARRQAIDRLDELSQSIFYEMFGDPKSNPQGLPTEELGNLIKVKSGESLTSEAQNAEGGIPVYGGNGVTGYHDEYMFNEPKLVIGRVGVYCGSVHLTEKYSWVTDNALFVIEIPENLHLDYLEAALRYANLNQYAGRSSQPLVSGSRIYPVKILVPKLQDQILYASRITELKNLNTFYDLHLTKLDKLFQSLQSLAFRGEL